LLLHAPEQRFAIMSPQFVVLQPLRSFKLAEDRLLSLRRQLACYLLLGSPENERPQCLG
jgi:hypothetical protein